MKLNLELIKNNCKELISKGYILPKYDIAKTRENTLSALRWVHFGAGNIFRAFQATVWQHLLNDGIENTLIVAAEGFDYDIVDKIYTPHDNLGIAVTLKADGTIDKEIVGSVMALKLQENTEDYNVLADIFVKPSLQMASFTITEKGYSLSAPDGLFRPDILNDFQVGPHKATSYMGKVAALLYARYKAGKLPIAMVSMDNCSHNGDKLKSAITEFANKWFKNHHVDQDFVDYVNDETKVSFPWSMIDKITPRPDAKVEAILESDGFEDVAPIVTSRNTYISSFVNAEEVQYLVIEDKFPNGKPDLARGGIIFTDRDTVDKVEKMKVCTCLNPLHTALAIFGCLLGHTLISEEMKDTVLRRLVERLGYVEGLSVVVDPGIISPKSFIDEVLKLRVVNPFMPDTPQRIATDTSQKVAIRFGETIKSYIARPDLDVDSLTVIPLVIAGWCRYLMGVDDKGLPFELSSDPMLGTLQPYLANVKLGDGKDHSGDIAPILSNEKIFGVNLHEIGMSRKIEMYFSQMTEKPGAVRCVLENVIGLD